MIDFSLKHILLNSPYDITLSEQGFIFQTAGGVHYREILNDFNDMAIALTNKPEQV